jgi:hypothetical protein
MGALKIRSAKFEQRRQLERTGAARGAARAKVLTSGNLVDNTWKTTEYTE